MRLAKLLSLSEKQNLGIVKSKDGKRISIVNIADNTGVLIYTHKGNFVEAIRSDVRLDMALSIKTVKQCARILGLTF